MSENYAIQTDYESDKVFNIQESAIGSLLPASDLNTLRKELLETIGYERTRDFLFRYGWHSGVKDAQVMLSIHQSIIRDALLAGPKMHFYRGYVEKFQTTHFELNEQAATLQWEVSWNGSFEAREHINQFGFSDHCVCHNIIGYATGYISTVLGVKVIINEVECEAMGHQSCRFICFTEIELNGKLDEDIRIIEGLTNRGELDLTYEQMKIERDNLIKVNQIYEKLIKQTFHENSLSWIADELYQTMNLPVLIEDKNHNLIAAAGHSKVQTALNRSVEISDAIKKTQYLATDSDGHKLITPVFIKREIVGYCSFLYQNTLPQEVDVLILEKAALACSVNLYNERNQSALNQRMSNEFLIEIIKGLMNIKDVAKKAYYLGFDIEPTYFVLSIQPFTNKISPLEQLKLNENLLNWLNLYFKNADINVLVGKELENIVILISDKSVLLDPLIQNKLSNDLQNALALKYPKYQFKLGISSTSDALGDVSRLYEESVASLKIANENRSIIFFDSLGIVGFLFQMKNPNIIQKYRLDKLVEEDQKKNTELTKTLYHYLNNGCNLNKTARVMNFSISGLRYRLQRLNDILQIEINKPTISYQLFTALQYLILLENLDFGNEIMYGELEGH